MNATTTWLDQQESRLEHRGYKPADQPAFAAISALRAVTSHETARRIVAMTHQITPEELTSDDLWLVQEIEEIIAAAVASSLGVE